MARITGIGGVFFRSPDPKALAAWYRDVLGIAIEDWGGAMIANTDGPGYAVWSPFSKGSDHFKPSTREYMMNFAVDDLDGFVKQLEAKGVAVLGREKMDGMGSFAWIMDPDGTKLELWQPEKE